MERDPFEVKPGEPPRSAQPMRPQWVKHGWLGSEPLPPEFPPNREIRTPWWGWLLGVTLALMFPLLVMLIVETVLL